MELRAYAGSNDSANGKNAILMVSARAESNKLVPGQVRTEEKSNEIKAIPELLKTLELAVCIVTIEPTGGQKKNAQQIRNQGSDYCLALKAHRAASTKRWSIFWRWGKPGILRNPSRVFLEETSRGQGRGETRTYWISWDLEWLENRHEWHDLKLIGMVESKRWPTTRRAKSVAILSRAWRQMSKSSPKQYAVTRQSRTVCTGVWM